MTLGPGRKPKLVVVAKESQGLRAVYPLINRVGEVELLLDSGSQIILMARNVAKNLEVNWDPDITIEMESANRSVKKTLGLAKNVPFTCGGIMVYLQVQWLKKLLKCLHVFEGLLWCGMMTQPVVLKFSFNILHCLVFSTSHE